MNRRITRKSHPSFTSARSVGIQSNRGNQFLEQSSANNGIFKFHQRKSYRSFAWEIDRESVELPAAVVVRVNVSESTKGETVPQSFPDHKQLRGG